ncbi:MAG: response regulator transcription factor [bacterium]
MKILIAEDDGTSRVILTKALEKIGHQVVATVDGVEALKVMQSPDAPHLAILDWLMPNMDGVEVCRRIRVLHDSPPPYIILLTIKGEKEHIVAGLDAGANDYISKPYDLEELRARLDVGQRMLALQDTLSTKVNELQKALDEVQTLRGIVPICANCKKIRDDKGFWQQVERYLTEHSEVRFTHGTCPECMRKLYPEFLDSIAKG